VFCNNSESILIEEVKERKVITILLEHFSYEEFKVKLSLYTPLRRLWREEAWLMLVLDLGVR
jgi:hypothetical protein